MNNIKIAYLILGHTDPKHIARLANRLTDVNSDIYIHIDKKTNIKPFSELLKNNKQVFFVSDRVSISWGGFNSVKATLSLINDSVTKGDYQRFVLLQGLDYPVVSNEEITSFFEKNNDVEFIRACKITGSNDKYHSKKCECFWFFEKKNIIKSMVNKLNTYFPLKLRKGYVEDRGKYDIYWGSAQWALTKDCIDYILKFSKSHKKFNKYFKYVFPPDETYFHSIVHNSIFSKRTKNHGPELEKRGLVNWRNLHYFEYDKSIKTFKIDDYLDVINSECLFFRKATTESSTELLNLLDQRSS